MRQQLGIDSSAFVLATSGSLIHRKGVDLIIDSLHKLDAVMLNIHLIVIGEGEERAQLEQQANHLQLHNNIHFLGERDNVVGLLKSGMDAYISGARDEAFGLALIEASLAKLPVIAPMVGGSQKSFLIMIRDFSLNQTTVNHLQKRSWFLFKIHV